MSRKKCRRKVWPLVNPVEHAISGATVPEREKLDELLTVEIASLNAMIHGKGNMSHWQNLAALNNLTMTLVGQGVGPEALEAAQKAEAALIDAAARFQKTGRMGFTGPAIQAIRDVIEYHDLQRSSISRSEYEKAIQLTLARIRSGYATIDLDKTLGKPFPVTA